MRKENLKNLIHRGHIKDKRDGERLPEQLVEMDSGTQLSKFRNTTKGHKEVLESQVYPCPDARTEEVAQTWNKATTMISEEETY